jgi:PhoH-like ATPase
MPGDVNEKFAPWAEPAMECLRVAYRGDEKTLDALIKSGKVVCKPVTYERGRTYPGSIVVIDEVQNMAPKTVKMLVTRPGEETKMVFIGDYHQIDNPLLDPQSNGLAVMIHRMAGHHLTAHLRLEKGERSELAEFAANVL